MSARSKERQTHRLLSSMNPTSGQKPKCPREKEIGPVSNTDGARWKRNAKLYSGKAKYHACTDCNREFSHLKALEKHISTMHKTSIEDSLESIQTDIQGQECSNITEDTERNNIEGSQSDVAMQSHNEQDNDTAQVTKQKYKCSVPLEFLNSGQPLCLQTGEGHVVDEALLTAGQDEATCQLCGKRMRRGPAPPKSTTEDVEEFSTRRLERTVEQESSEAQDKKGGTGLEGSASRPRPTIERENESKLGQDKRKCFDFLMESGRSKRRCSN